MTLLGRTAWYSTWRFDPQKLAKNQASHERAVGEFEKALIKHRAKKTAAASLL